MKLLVVALILPATIVLVIAAFETELFYPVPSNAPAKGIVWDGHTFATRGDFARWLRSRGVRYAVWARRHPSSVSVGAGRSEGERAGHKSSDWAVKTLGGVAVLAGLGLVAVFVGRRWPGSGGSARQTLRLAGRRAAPAARRGTRLLLRWAKTTALLSSRMAKSLAKLISRRGTEIARSFAHRAAPAAKRGARLMLRSASAAALLPSRLAASSAKTIRRRRGEFAWYFASALLATSIGLLATVWLNRG
jgi:hypothetical protein